MLVNVFFVLLQERRPSICINTSVHQIQRECIIVTSTTQLRHYVITATLLIQRQRVNMM